MEDEEMEKKVQQYLQRKGSDNDPARYHDGYSKLRTWAYSSLDQYKAGLFASESAAADVAAKAQADAAAAKAAADAAASKANALAARQAAQEAAAAAHPREALDRATRERQAAATALDDKDDAHSIATDASLPDGEGDLNDALLLHEAAAVLNLHAQGVAVQSIQRPKS
ncbi:tol-Pal system protein TolA-like [Panicum virgatum]|uniref:tol-Pal system protein TolA-like n=1 Tax=Panicum virgatum TaxID=38727 RepID=UPI0019D5E9FE|nr:tol-Pal system protein TolA-like [Panicum virgatum]